MRCFFHLVSNHDEIIDNAGIEVHDLESAKEQALHAIEELKAELGTEADGWSEWRLEIVCPMGTLLYSMRLAETVH